MDQFLDQIKDKKYEVTITNLRMDNGKTLETCIEAISVMILFYLTTGSRNTVSSRSDV